MPSKPNRSFKPAEIALFLTPLLVLCGLGVIVLKRRSAPPAVAMATPVPTAKPTARPTPRRVRGSSGFNIRPARLETIAFSPDSQQVATGDSSGAIKWWSVADGSPSAVLQTVGEPVNDMAYSPDGKLFAATSGNSLLLYDYPTGVSHRVIHGNFKRLRALAFSPDGLHIAAAQEPKVMDPTEIAVWDVATGGPVYTLNSGIRRVYSLVFSQDGAHLALSGEADGFRVRVQYWDIKTRQKLWETEADIDSGPLRFLPGEGRLAVSSFHPVVLNARNGKLDKLMMSSKFGDGRHLAVSRDGTTLIGSGYGRKLMFWNAATGKVLDWSRLDTTNISAFGWSVSQFAFSSDEKRMVHASGSIDVVMWDTSHLKIGQVLADPSQLRRVRRLWTLNPMTGQVIFPPER